MNAAVRLFGACDALVRWVAGLFLLVITATLFVNSVARYFAGIVIIGGEELARYLMVWLTFLGAYLLVRVQRHVTVDVLARLAPAGVMRAIDLASAAVGAVVLGYVAWRGWELASFVLATGQMSSSLPMRRGWVYLSVPVGCGLMAAAYALQLYVRLFGGQLPRPSDYGLPDDDIEAAGAEPAPSQRP